MVQDHAEAGGRCASVGIHQRLANLTSDTSLSLRELFPRGGGGSSIHGDVELNNDATIADCGGVCTPTLASDEKPGIVSNLARVCGPLLTGGVNAAHFKCTLRTYGGSRRSEVAPDIHVIPSTAYGCLSDLRLRTRRTAGTTGFVLSGTHQACLS